MERREGGAAVAGSSEKGRTVTEHAAGDRPLRILHLIIVLGPTNGQYNEHCLPLMHARDLSICTYFTPQLDAPPEIQVFAGDDTLRGFFRALGAALAAKEFDVIHAHAPHTGALLTFATDAFGRLLTSQGPLDRFTYEYGDNSFGGLSLSQTRVLHAERGDPAADFSADETLLVLTSTAFNRPSAWVLTRAGHSAAFSLDYDERGRVSAQKRGTRVLAEFRYDALDRTVRKVDARGGVWRSFQQLS